MSSLKTVSDAVRDVVTADVDVWVRLPLCVHEISRPRRGAMSGIRRWRKIVALLHRMNEKHKVKPTEGETIQYKKKATRTQAF